VCTLAPTLAPADLGSLGTNAFPETTFKPHVQGGGAKDVGGMETRSPLGRVGAHAPARSMAMARGESRTARRAQALGHRRADQVSITRLRMGCRATASRVGRRVLFGLWACCGAGGKAIVARFLAGSLTAD
jgi:hypothetical protein